jgi:hypothetical protein
MSNLFQHRTVHPLPSFSAKSARSRMPYYQLQDPLVATPISGVQAPRRSRQLSSIGVEFDLHKEKSNLHKEKSKLVRKAMVALKCISENEEINNEALQEYAALFNRCLNQVQVEALSALFS